MTTTGHNTSTSKLPDGWSTVALKDVADVRLGRQRSPKNHTGTQMRRYLRAANVTWTGLSLDDVAEMNFTDDEMSTYLLQPGDILVNEASGSPSEVGKAAIFDSEIEGCAFQNTLIRVRAHSADTKYLYLFLTCAALTGAYLKEARGVGIFHLGKTNLAAWPTPIPPLAEQARIVEILEAHLSRLDAALQHIQTLRDKASQFRRSLLHAAFTGALTGHDPSTSELPDGWKLDRLDAVVEVLDSKRKPINAKQREERPGTVPYYGATGQVGTIDEALFDEPLVLLGEDGVQFFDPDKPKAYEIDGPAWVNNHAHVLRPDEDKIPRRLLVHYLNQFDYRGSANGTTRLKLTQKAMNAIPIVLPPLEEQHQIVEILEGHLSRLDAAMAVADAVEERAGALRRSLLHAAFTGKLTEKWREQAHV